MVSRVGHKIGVTHWRSELVNEWMNEWIKLHKTAGYLSKIIDILANLRDISGSDPDHCNKTSVAITQVGIFLLLGDLAFSL